MSLTTLRSARCILGSVSIGSQALKKNVAVLLMSHRCESSLPPIKTEKINGNMQLKLIKDGCQIERPLVLLFGWMLAKQKHLDKYGNLYHSKGLDVLTLKMNPSQIILPQRAQSTINQLLTVLEDSNLAQKPLITHGFSVGGYMYGEMLVKMEQERQRWQNVSNRMIGQIFDSPVDLEGVPSGFSQVLLKNKVGRMMMRSTLEGYLKFFHAQVTRHYEASFAAFHANELRLPSLMLYSRADPIGSYVNIERVIDAWKRVGSPVMTRCWESSPHVSHFHRHPDEYVEAVLDFLDSINISQQKKKAKDEMSSKREQRTAEIQQAI